MVGTSTRWLTALTMLFVVCTSTAARAELPLQLAGTVESTGIVPTSSTKQQALSLQFLVPLTRLAGTRFLAGLGPLAMTRQLLTSTIPELVAFGAAGSFRLEF